jgi:hypothetical protein
MAFPYLSDDPKGWARKYYDFLTSANVIQVWQTQIGSGSFPNVKQFLYQCYVKLAVLDDHTYAFKNGKVVDGARANDLVHATLGQQMLSVFYSALLQVFFQKGKWLDEFGPFITPIINDILEGNIEGLPEDVNREEAKHQREALQELQTLMEDKQVALGDQLAIGIRGWVAQNPDKLLRNYTGDIYDGLGRLFGEGTPERTKWQEYRGVGTKLIGGIVYAASAGYLLYTIVRDGKAAITPESIVEDVNLGLLSIGLFAKGAERVMALGLGDLLRGYALKHEGIWSDLGRMVAGWFTSGEITHFAGPIAEKLTALFGRNVGEFFAKRLGPALAVVNMVLSGFWLADAIKKGDVPDIIIQAALAALALLEVVALGFELAGFAWAGPVGFAVAITGLIISFVALIWSLVSPPEPPATPVAKFVTGPMVQHGFAK